MARTLSTKFVIACCVAASLFVTTRMSLALPNWPETEVVIVRLHDAQGNPFPGDQFFKKIEVTAPAECPTKVALTLQDDTTVTAFTTSSVLIILDSTYLRGMDLMLKKKNKK